MPRLTPLRKYTLQPHKVVEIDTDEACELKLVPALPTGDVDQAQS